MAEDAARGAYFPDATEAWRVPAVAAARDAWTAGHLDRHRDRTRDGLLRGLDHHGSRLVTALRRGDSPAADGPPWMVVAPVADLAVHLADLREALGASTGRRRRRRPARIRASTATGCTNAWSTGSCPHSSSATATTSGGSARGTPPAPSPPPRHELFRMISGRRSPAQIGRYDWTVDPTPYLPVISPYPLPD